MEILTEFGTPDSSAGLARAAARRRDPLLLRDDGAGGRELGRDEHRRAASSATATSTSSTATSGGPAAPRRERCKIAIFMGVTDPEADPHRRHSMILVPLDTPGVEIMRTLPGVRLRPGPRRSLRGRCSTTCACRPRTCSARRDPGFAIAQARLGPGRIHHCMRAIGMAERAFDLMCERAHARVHVRQAARAPGRDPRLDRRVADRDRAGAPAGAEDRLADGHTPATRARGSRSPRSRSRRPRSRCGDRPRDPGARRRRRQRRLPARGDVRRPRARCGSPTGPTRCTSSRSRAASCAATSRSSRPSASRSADAEGPLREARPHRVRHAEPARGQERDRPRDRTSCCGETWEDFRDDDSLDVAIVTGAGDAFCAGADLKTFIPPRITRPRPRAGCATTSPPASAA